MKKIQGRWRIMLYAMGGMGINMLNLMMGSYLCSALLAGGFGEQAVRWQTYVGADLVIAAVWSVMVLIAKIIDGVIDVPMASFTDNLRTRWGRRRPALLLGMGVTVAAYLLFLVVPNPAGATLLNTLYYGVVLCVYYCAYTLTMVTYYATFTEIVETVEERSLMSNTKSVFDILYYIAGYVLVPMMLKGINIRGVALIVLPLALTMLIPLVMIREPSTKDAAPGAEKAEGERYGLFASLRLTFRNRTFILWMITYSFMTFGVQLFLGGINEYFSKVGMSMMVTMATAFAPVPFTLLIYNHIQKKRGFGAAFRYVLVTYIIGMLMIWWTGTLDNGTGLKTAMSVVSGLVSSLGIGALFAVAYSIPSELAAEEGKRTGVGNSAMYFGVQGLFAGVATGIGTGLVLNALKGTQEAHSDAIVYLTLISAAGVFVSLLLTFMLPKRLLGLGKQGENAGK